MKRTVLLLLFFFRAGMPVQSAEEPLARIRQASNPFFRSILSLTSDPEIGYVYQFQRGYLRIGDRLHEDNPYDILPAGGRVYIHIGATGYLYELKALPGSDSVEFVRLDKTTHFGYNINAYSFTLGDQVYNMGGYGYWRWNGQLRAFNHKMKEWHIIPLNMELPLSHGAPYSFVWLDKSTRQMHLLRTIQGNEAVRGQGISWGDTVYQMDMRDYSWHALGVHNHSVILSQKQEVLLALDSGLLVSHGGEIKYWNFKRNRILELVDDSLRGALLAKMGNMFIWHDRGMIFYGSPAVGTIDSMALAPSSFTDTPEMIYVPFSNGIPAYLWLIPVLAASAIFFKWLRKRKHKVPLNHHTDVLPPDPEPVQQTGASSMAEPADPVLHTAVLLDAALFDEVERSLLRLLYHQMEDKGRRTGSQEVNRILGVGNKTLDMQKRKRSDVIRSINRKFQLVHPNKSVELILKDKSDLDGRLSEYLINPSEHSFVKQLI